MIFFISVFIWLLLPMSLTFIFRRDSSNPTKILFFSYKTFSAVSGQLFVPLTANKADFAVGGTTDIPPTAYGALFHRKTLAFMLQTCIFVISPVGEPQGRRSGLFGHLM